jgi:hypothetical protein
VKDNVLDESKNGRSFPEKEEERVWFFKLHCCILPEDATQFPSELLADL